MSTPSPIGPEMNPSQHEQATPQTLAEVAVARSPVSPALMVRPMPPTMPFDKRADAASEKMRKDIDLLAPLFLETLDDIERAGLTEHYAMPVRQSVRAYMTIMDGAWEALAEERLSEVINGSGYEAEVTKLHHWLLDRKKRCAEAIAALKAKGEEAPTPPSAWRRRAKLYRQAIRSWEQCLDHQGDAHAAGQGLFRMHGYYGLSALRTFELGMLSILRWATAGVAVLVILAYLTVSFIPPDAHTPPLAVTSPLTTLAILGVQALFASYIIGLNAGGSAPIQIVVGYAMAPRQKVDFTAEGVSVVPTAVRRRRMRRFLEIWCLVVLGAAPLIGLAAFAGLSVLNSIFATGNMGQTLVSLSGYTSLLLVAILPLAYLFFLPFVVYTQILLSRDLAEHPDWEVSARRYALRFSLILLPFEIGGALVISIALRQWLSLQDYTLLTIGSQPLTGSLVLYLLAFTLPYLAFIDLPYRFGVNRWRQKHLKELRAARRLAEGEIARLPLKGEAKEDLHELEYHLGWIQYYQSAMAEISETSESPFSVERRTTALLLATPLPLVIAALQDLQGRMVSQDVFELIQKVLTGGK
jgi:hypothetical protein